MAHSEIASFPESHFLLVTSRSRRGRWMRKLGLVSPEMRRQLAQFLVDIGQPALLPPVTVRVQPFVQRFASILDQLTVAQGKSIWLEKTPGHLYYIDEFTRVLPEARFIHLIRNGKDVVASLYKVTNLYPEQWGRRYTIDDCIALWHRCLQLTQSYSAKSNHCVIHYETLVTEPAVTLKRLLTFIGVTYEPAMLTAQPHVAKAVILADEPWKMKAMSAIDARPHQEFQTIFSLTEQQYILERLQSEMVSKAMVSKAMVS